MVFSQSKKTILWTLVAIWIIGCILQYVFCCTDTQDVATTPVAKTLVVSQAPAATQKTPKKLLVQGIASSQTDEEITFPQGKATNNPIAPALVKAVSGVPAYLSAHKDDSLTVTGYYLADEANGEKLGMSRAEAIKSWLVKQQVPANRIVTRAEKRATLTGADDQHRIATAMAITEKANQQTAKKTPKKPAEKKPLVTSAAPVNGDFSVQGDGISLLGANNFSFDYNSALPNRPIPVDLDANISQLVRYLNADNSRQLTVIGGYDIKEENNSVFETLGLGRANQVRDYLVAEGANGRQIDIADSATNGISVDDKQVLTGLMTFSVTQLDKDAWQAQNQAMTQIADEIRAEPLILYFKTGVTEISLDALQREKLANIIRYLNFDSRAKAVVTGHTDNVGSRSSNIRLALKRARFASEQLEKKGLHFSQMIIASKGPDEPIADNETDKGRALNRRVVITIQENIPEKTGE